jgi:hypothetical protein
MYPGWKTENYSLPILKDKKSFVIMERKGEKKMGKKKVLRPGDTMINSRKGGASGN